jgi:hypothetical protein
MIGTVDAKLSAEEAVARAVMTDVLTDVAACLASLRKDEGPANPIVFRRPN